MRKWLPLLLLVVFIYDIGADSFDADCLDASEACHACICRTHATDPSAPHESDRVTQTASPIFSSDPRLSQSLFDKSFFHPPKTLA
jgi:hypothetical protein